VFRFLQLIPFLFVRRSFFFPYIPFLIFRLRAFQSLSIAIYFTQSQKCLEYAYTVLDYKGRPYIFFQRRLLTTFDALSCTTTLNIIPFNHLLQHRRTYPSHPHLLFYVLAMRCISYISSSSLSCLPPLRFPYSFTSLLCPHPIIVASEQYTCLKKEVLVRLHVKKLI